MRPSESGSGDSRSAVVVGAGIGGLSAAVALRRIGWSVTVLERAPVIADVGAGLSLWPNAVAALALLDLDEAMAARAVRAVTRGNIRNPDGRWVRHAHPSDVSVLVVHRADLHQVLRDALPRDVLHTDATVVSITERDGAQDGATVTYESQGARQEVTANLVVAADGIDSAIRRQLWPGHPVARFQHRTVWRGVTEPDAVWPIQESLTLGRAEQFGLLPLTGHRVYWFLTVNADQPGRRYDDEHAEVRRRVGGWHDPIPALIDATHPDHVLHNDVLDLDPLPTFVHGRTVLLGDAAHAMSPDLGQGGCQAIEDAVVLADALRTDADVTGALASYDQQRRTRAQGVAAAARKSNARNSNDSALAYAATNLAARLVPPGLWRKSTAQWSTWTPPATLGNADPRDRA
jgi:2-polyprenyl-6-methoxyphenol hydroxylase-like FAD-dependent oxidoreductase